MGERTNIRGGTTQLIQKAVLGIGFLVQGLRCFPWAAVFFFLKDVVKVHPAGLQILQNFANLPFVAKPLYGIVSDTFYIRGQHRIPYIAIGAFMQAVSWLVIASLTSTNMIVICFYLLISNLGAGIAEVANDAIVAEAGKQPNGSQSSPTGELQSFVWMASSVGGALGNILGGIAIDRFSNESIFKFFGILVAIQFLLTISVRESSLNLPRSPSHEGMSKQISDLWTTLKQPEIAYSIIWFAASYAVVPALTGSAFYFQTQHLKLSTTVLGLSKVFGQGVSLLWSFVYNRRLNSVSPRKLICDIHVLMAILMILDALSVEGFFERIGISDPVYTVFFTGFLDVLLLFKMLPFSVLMAQLCPPGCEGSLMAFVTSAVALAFIVNGFWGIALSAYFGVTGTNFSKFSQAISIQAACALLPLFWSSWIPDEPRARRKRKKEE